MRIIDRKWTGLAPGYRELQLLQARLETEFGRAVQVGHKQQFRRELTNWQKKRRALILMALISVLSIIILCVSAFYLRSREVGCVLVYWAVLVLVILVTLAVAGRSYIREVIDPPEPKRDHALQVDLEQRWWDSLASPNLALVKPDGKHDEPFLSVLRHSLPEAYAMIDVSAPADADVLVVGPSGVWLFVVRHWDGTILRADGVWKQVLRNKPGRKQGEERPVEAPDERWQRLKGEIAGILQQSFPDAAWTGGLVKGGVIFSHPKVKLDKNNIRDNTASYGPVRPWLERLSRAVPVEGFTPELQLAVLDGLHDWFGRDGTPAVVQPVSATDEAGRLYQQAAEELRQYVAKMVK